MGVEKKYGKGRLDKWYKLAKEKGYRARAAFKLIQLNRKYGFLEKSKVLLDLCAAPGSWCQVAAETMPTNSLIVGVDLAPIKPIPHTITFQSDITTDKCRATIRQHLKTWKADTVLHDGAPNVGIAWVQDAFSQAELTLQALKLATDFLAEGGTFVTKVFRSKDYNALLWVLNQLFCKVEATKPPSSRNVSAEIFVVCRAFKAPKRIDPRLLDPRSVFAELTNATPNNEAKVFNPERKKRKREGYDEGDYVQFKEIPASAFVQSTDPIALLGTYNRFTLDQDADGDIVSTALARLAETTNEIRNCCSDLRVLGRKEFRILLRWRLKAREIFGLRTRKGAEVPKSGEEVAEVTPMSEEMRVQEELRGMQAKETSRKKRERRRENEKRQKDIVRMQLHMLAPTEIGLEQTGPFGEGAIFNLNTLKSSRMIDRVARGSIGPPMFQDIHRSSDAESSSEMSDDLEDHLDGDLDALYDRYRQRQIQNSAKYRALRSRKEEGDGVWEGLSADEEIHGSTADVDVGSDEQSSADEDFLESLQLDSLEDPQPPYQGLSRRTAMFFDQDIFKGIDGLDTVEDRDSAIDLDSDSSAHEVVKANTNSAKSGAHEGAVETCDASIAKLDPIRSAAKGVPLSQSEINQHYSLASSPLKRKIDSEDAFEIVKLKGHVDEIGPGVKKATGPSDLDIVTAEAMSFAQQLATGQKSAGDAVDEGFNKYAFRDRDGLPEWFLDDENRHSKPQKPITAAGAAAIKAKLRALNARPIKKVREAKDRKKMKAAQRLEKLRKKSALIADEEGVSEKDKAQNISALMGRASKKKPKQRVRLVVAKGGNRGISGRPRGVKGKYKIVDPRLKKDVRAERRTAKRQR